MKKILKLFSVLAIFSMPLCFSQESSSEKINNALNKTLSTLVDVVPENTMLLSIEPDAHIGKFLPAVPPHFTAGLNITGTFTDTSNLSDSINVILSQMKDTANEEITGIEQIDSILMNFKFPSKLPVPTCAVTGRIGGFVLPFDIGVFAVALIPHSLDAVKFKDFSLGLDYMSFGADIRYAVFEGNILLPKISVGAGYIYSSQSIDFFASSAQTVKVENTERNMNMNADMNMDLKVHTFYAQVQVSKSILILRPFIGARARFSFIDANHKWNYDAEVEGINEKATNNGSATIKIDSFAWDEIQPQIYCGLGIKIPFVEFGLDAAWNPRTNMWSMGILTEFKM